MKTRFRYCVALLAVAASCGEPPVIPGGPPPDGEFITDIAMPTYDRSGETVHPDFAGAPAWWPEPTASYLAITPYPNGDATKENPSLFVGSLDRWELPQDAPNPVRFPDRGYLSDPDIVFNPDVRELFMYHRQVSGSNDIQLVTTADARRWSVPQTVVSGPNHAIVSPAVVRRGTGDWLMWSVNAGSLGCTAPSTIVEMRRSLNGISWGQPETIELGVPGQHLYPWHLDVQWIEALQEYWAVFNVKDAHNCGTTAVFIATSADGVHWLTRPRPIAVAGEVLAINDIVYRTTFRYDASIDQVTFWYSGARRGPRGFVWSTILQRVARSTLLESAAQSDTRALTVIPASVMLPEPP